MFRQFADLVDNCAEIVLIHGTYASSVSYIEKYFVNLLHISNINYFHSIFGMLFACGKSWTPYLYYWRSVNPRKTQRWWIDQPCYLASMDIRWYFWLSYEMHKPWLEFTFRMNEFTALVVNFVDVHSATIWLFCCNMTGHQFPYTVIHSTNESSF